MKKIQFLFGLIVAFVTHISAFAVNPSINNFNEQDNYQKALNFSGLSNFDNYDDNFDDFDDFENMDNDFEESFENFKRKGYNPVIAKQQANTLVKGKYGNTKWGKYVATKTNQSLIGGRGVRGAVATLGITISRLNVGTGILNTTVLPLPLFGAMHRNNNYQFINGFIPAGVTLFDVLTDRTTGTLIFVYQSIAVPSNQSLISVKCNEIAYSTVVDATLIDSFQSGVLNYEVNKLDIAQFDRDLQITSKSMYGLGKVNTISIKNAKNPKNFQDNILVITNPFEIDKEQCLIIPVKATLTSEITLNFNVTKYYKQNKNKLG